MIGAISNTYFPNTWRWAMQATARTSPVWAAQRGSNPEAAVEPVTPVRSVPEVDASRQRRLYRSELPSIQEGVDPVEWAVRMRIQPAENTNRAEKLPGAQNAEEAAQTEKLAGVQNGAEKTEKTENPRETAEEAKCETCENRKYQDGSDDPGVSFKIPTSLSPERAVAAVRGHEQEHVTREQAKAQREGRRVVSQSVTYRTGVCPECGRIYVAGGTTRTVTAAIPEDEKAKNSDTGQQQDENQAGLPAAIA